ncbi:sodium:solute symporter family protein [Bacillus altitudinis]|uniref:sodium:solute symporter family protein n=1 Tax=Bacillus altitudinis TaxID=293387 RepID=UPI000C24097C|nr:sodium:solute symporter [Bacillus altitudinis]MCY7440099.1 sodium:solute symporter [Bacillus altitudinis]MEC1144145.1 sodium:solute symporter [Bacillus altitudinis]PJI12174.1 symporter [Bacillus altitudinis]PKQ85129.1 symporter [Bacillus altitudinis]GJI58124.1 putative symporter YodF [Bacillus altitudinis]
MQGNLTALLITASIIFIVVVIGFAAGRDKSSRQSVEEWSVGGRKFGGLLVWFLVGADLYTAYTFLGLTSTAYTAGSVAFFAIPYSVLAYFIAYFFLPKLWTVAKNHKLTTLADYARERFDSKLLSSLIAIVGVLMLIPYICLQLSGIQDTLTVAGTSYINVNAVVMISFILVALYTFFSGIKGPTYTAIIKDILVWVIMLFMVVSLPIIHFNGWTPMMNTLAKEAPQLLTIPEGGPKGILWFITASGVSALALFMWAHAATGVFTAKSADAIRKNSMFLPLYNIVLILVIFLGFIAFLVLPEDTNPRFALLHLIQTSYGGVMQGLAYSTIALASLIPCSIMAIGASNLFANNLYRDLIHPTVSPKRLTIITRSMVFIVIGLALLFGMLFPTALVTLQLIGVSGMVQIFPAIAISLFWKKQSREATIAGLVVGIIVTFTANISQVTFGLYEGFLGLLANVVVILILNPFFQKKITSNSVMNDLFEKDHDKTATTVNEV